LLYFSNRLSEWFQIETIFDWLYTNYPVLLGLDHWSLIDNGQKKLLESLISYILLVCN
jgi:hypothetical protein